MSLSAFRDSFRKIPMKFSENFFITFDSRLHGLLAHLGFLIQVGVFLATEMSNLLVFLAVIIHVLLINILTLPGEEELSHLMIKNKTLSISDGRRIFSITRKSAMATAIAYAIVVFIASYPSTFTTNIIFLIAVIVQCEAVRDFLRRVEEQLFNEQILNELKKYGIINTVKQ